MKGGEDMNTLNKIVRKYLDENVKFLYSRNSV